MTAQVLVPFEGEGSGVEELTWGQRVLWDAMRRQRSWLPLGAVLPLPPGTTVDEIVADVRFLMSRNQSLRTRLRFDPDGPKQVVSRAGEIHLDVVDAADDADPEEVAHEVSGSYHEIAYDYVSHWPVWFAVVRHRGVLTHRVMVACHLVTDGGGAALMWADLAGRDPVTGEAATPPAPMQPLEQARWQRTAPARQLTDRAMRHWEALLRTIPARRFPDPVDRGRPRHLQGILRSPALHLAVRAIIARTRVDSSSVLLTLFAVAAGRLIGVNPAAIQVLASNRFRPGLAHTVSPINQTALCVLDLADRTVDQAVQETRRRAMIAYKHAYYDPRRLDELLERVARERGEQLDIACYFNDRRIEARDPAGAPAPLPEQVAAALPLTTFEWEREQDDPFERLFVHINNVADLADLTVCGDTHYLSRADLEACARGMETVAVEAAFDPAAPTRVPRRAGWPVGTGVGTG
jgi:hypothetical protein